MLKDIIRDDVKGVLLDLDEMADTHVIDGVEVLAIVDSPTSKEHMNMVGRSMDGLLTADRVTVYLAREDLGYTPEYGDAVTLDGRAYSVESASDEMGMVSMVLVRSGM